MSEGELKTEKYIIGYIDLLGSKEKIIGDSTGYWLNAVSKLYIDAWNRANELKEFYSHEKPFIKVFSDNILVAEKLHDDDADKLNSIFRILYFLSYIQSRALIDYQWLVRGAVVVGDLYVGESNTDVSKSFIWGMGLVNAHYIEDNIAIFPRVIIDKSVYEAYNGISLKSLFSRRRFIYEDMDGLSCLNYLGVYIDEDKTNKGMDILNSASRSLRNMTHEFGDKDVVLQKITWTKNYLVNVRRISESFPLPLRGRVLIDGKRLSKRRRRQT